MVAWLRMEEVLKEVLKRGEQEGDLWFCAPGWMEVLLLR